MSKTRRSSSKPLETVGGIAAGLLVGGMGVPKLVSTIDPEGKIGPTAVNAAVAAGAFFFARKQKGFMQSALYGLSAGSAAALVSGLLGGIGYVDSPSTSFLNRVAGGDYFPSRQDPGDV